MNPCRPPGVRIVRGALDDIHIEPFSWIWRDPEGFEIAACILWMHRIIRSGFNIAVKSRLSLHDLTAESLSEEDLAAVPFADEVTKVSFFFVDNFDDVTNRPSHFEGRDGLE